MAGYQEISPDRFNTTGCYRRTVSTTILPMSGIYLIQEDILAFDVVEYFEHYFS